MKFFDRLLTIVITATLTSMVWIVFGSTWIEAAEDQESNSVETLAEDEPVAPPTPDPIETAAAPEEDAVTAPSAEPTTKDFVPEDTANAAVTADVEVPPQPEETPEER